MINDQEKDAHEVVLKSELPYKEDSTCGQGIVFYRLSLKNPICLLSTCTVYRQ